jgi:hypothetical protein
MHPDLRGRLALEGKQLDIAVWTRQTKDGTRIYHSATISEPFAKGQASKPPLAKGLKLYEFRKRRDSDPDFQSSEGFGLFGGTYFAALWVELGAKDDFEALRFTLALLEKPCSEELTADIQHTLDALRARMLARAQEAEEEKAYREKQAAIEGDNLERLAEEPDSLPF